VIFVIAAQAAIGLLSIKTMNSFFFVGAENLPPLHLSKQETEFFVRILQDPIAACAAMTNFLKENL
jgi:precorrin-6x reductase